MLVVLTPAQPAAWTLPTAPAILPMANPTQGRISVFCLVPLSCFETGPELWSGTCSPVSGPQVQGLGKHLPLGICPGSGAVLKIPERTSVSPKTHNSSASLFVLQGFFQLHYLLCMCMHAYEWYMCACLSAPQHVSGGQKTTWKNSLFPTCKSWELNSVPQARAGAFEPTHQLLSLCAIT